MQSLSWYCDIANLWLIMRFPRTGVQLAKGNVTIMNQKQILSTSVVNQEKGKAQ